MGNFNCNVLAQKSDQKTKRPDFQALNVVASIQMHKAKSASFWSLDPEVHVGEDHAL